MPSTPKLDPNGVPFVKGATVKYGDVLATVVSPSAGSSNGKDRIKILVGGVEKHIQASSATMVAAAKTSARPPPATGKGRPTAADAAAAAAAPGAAAAPAAPAPATAPAPAPTPAPACVKLHKMKEVSQTTTVRDPTEHRKWKEAVFRDLGTACIVSGATLSTLIQACHIAARTKYPEISGSPANGLPLRADLHRLMDAGKMRFIVSSGSIGNATVTVHFDADFLATHRDDYGRFDKKTFPAKFFSAETKLILRNLADDSLADYIALLDCEEPVK
jgi:hypothetical protein